MVKANPAKYSFAQPATGSTPHLAGELFKQTSGSTSSRCRSTARRWRSSRRSAATRRSPSALPPAMSNIKDGKLRGLAVLGGGRSPALPDVPTNAEAGVPDHESDTLTGIVAPAGTPKEIIERWHEHRQDRGDARGQAAPGSARLRPIATRPRKFGARIKVEIAKWSKVVRDANIRPIDSCEIRRRRDKFASRLAQA